MALSDKLYQLVQRYVRGQPPVIEADLRRYIQDELSSIEATTRTLAEAAVQVENRAPEHPRIGMLRYAAEGWDPIGDGTTGLVVFDGTAWVAVLSKD